jgi:iron complex outermembrane receptor protein
VPAAAQEDQSEDGKTTVEKRIIVNARRLPDSGDSEAALPAAVTVISRRDIEASSARTLQELLAGWAGFTVVDNTGNGIETAIGLRGFSDGNALAVYVNGVRVNEPDSNLAHLEFIDLASIERIEILPGAGSASRGGGATAGSINIILRGGEDPGADVLRASGGSLATREAAVQSSRRFGRHGYFLSARLLDSDGFRDNGASEQRNLFATWRYGDPARDGFEISWRHYDGEMGNPGALTREELARDRSANPYNRVDFANSDERVISGRFGATPYEELHVTLLGWRRESTIEVLTTGRAAALYGGFRSTTDAEGIGFTGQVRWLPAEPVAITGGVDYQRDEFGNVASYTDERGAPTFSANDRETRQRNLAAYGEAALAVDGWLTLQAGVRHDRIDMEFTELLEDRADETDFSQTSGSFGALVNVGPATIWGRFSQSFQAPTVNDLFAFPFFGSNPDLKPTEGETWEAGLRFAGEGYSAQASLYRMNLENEVVFVILDPASFYGRNENVGESRRFGFEGSFSGELRRYLDLRVGYAWTRAKNLSLAAETGADELLIPLVPEHSFSATLRLDLTPMMFALTSIYTGSQILGSDSYNLGEPLEAYLLHHAVAAWDEGAWGLRLEVRNLLDEDYEPRAIYSFGSSYHTPAAGRTASLSVSFTY